MSILPADLYLCIEQFLRCGRLTGWCLSQQSATQERYAGVWVDGMDALSVKSATAFAKQYALENGPLMMEMVSACFGISALAMMLCAVRLSCC